MKKFNQISSYQMTHSFAVSVAATIFITSCASIPPPTEQMAVPKVAVSNASSAGGNEYAPLELKSAMNKMAGAEQAMAAEDYAHARQLAEQAQVDAQLAAATALSAKAQKAANVLQEDNRVLRQEIDRNIQY